MKKLQWTLFFVLSLALTSIFSFAGKNPCPTSDDIFIMYSGDYDAAFTAQRKRLCGTQNLRKPRVCSLPEKTHFKMYVLAQPKARKSALLARQCHAKHKSKSSQNKRRVVRCPIFRRFRCPTGFRTVLVSYKFHNRTCKRFICKKK